MNLGKCTVIKSFFWILLVFFYPAILTFLFPFLANGTHFETDIVENFAFSSFVLLLSSLYFSNKKTIVLFLLFLLYSFALIETMYLVLFRSYFNSSSLFIFFQSNSSEINSFLKQYCNLSFYFIFLSLTSLYLVFAYFFLKNKINFSKFDFLKKINKLVMLGLVIFGFLTLLFSPLSKSFFPKVLINGFLDYHNEMKAYDKMKFKKESNYFEDVTANKDTISETYILVIGESTTRTHMGIYGYNRQTTPLLNSISDELLIYKDVVTPNTHTLTSLEKVLTLGNTKNLNLKYEGNILQMFNQAGFFTYWISNQKPTGIWDNFISAISNSAQKRCFFNISDDASDYDEVVLNSFETILKEKKKKKLIVLHLMGTHLFYKDRYPSRFTNFKDKPNSKFQSETAVETINSYDNAVLYQDYIWFNIIKLIKNNTKKAAVLFISDHGEEVYDSIDFSGHSETKGTKSMYDIPFVVWMSNKKREEENNLVFDVNRKYSTENLIFTLADLASIKFKKIEPTQSVFNKQFKTGKRIIFNNQSYDEFFKKK
jgi:heptose-I-phosphate ethanolaminephosphotransferase